MTLGNTNVEGEVREGSEREAILTEVKPFVRLRMCLFIKLLGSVKRKDPRARLGGHFKEEGIDKVKCHKESKRIKTTELLIECDKVNSGLDEKSQQIGGGKNSNGWEGGMGPASTGDSRNLVMKERNWAMAKYRQRSRESLEFF